MPITSWRYKTQDASVRHVGPMAQDFHEAFGLGDDDRRINTLDLDGISLAAVKGLLERVVTLEETVATLEARLASIEEALSQR